MTEPLKPNEYQCAACGGIFEKAWSDEKAKEELSNTFPGYDTDDCSLICDDCFKRLGFG